MTSHGYKQNEISKTKKTKIFQTSYYTVLRAFSLKKINILTRVGKPNERKKLRSTGVFKYGKLLNLGESPCLQPTVSKHNSKVKAGQDMAVNLVYCRVSLKRGAIQLSLTVGN